MWGGGAGVWLGVVLHSTSSRMDGWVGGAKFRVDISPQKGLWSIYHIRDYNRIW